jgi:hypothetical protein
MLLLYRILWFTVALLDLSSVLSYGLLGLQMDRSYLPLYSLGGRVIDGMSNDLDL